MALASKICRYLLGAIFFIFGLNGFWTFIPVPPMAEPAQAFMSSLIGTGYMLPLWKGIEVASGLMLLTGNWVALALILLAPIIINILFFHLFLDPSHAGIGILVFALALGAAWERRADYAKLLRRK